VADSFVSLDALNAVIDDTPFLRPCGLRIVRAALGECEVLLPYSTEIERPDGLISGMAIVGCRLLSHHSMRWAKVTGSPVS